MKKTLLLFSLLFAGVAFGFVVAARFSATESTYAAPPPGQAVQSRTAALATNSPLPDLSSVAERALKVGANITSTVVLRQQLDPIFQMFYGRREITQEQNQLGSGVVVTDDGYILTNNHVIGNAGAAVQVTLPDGKELPAKIIGVDDITDLAVVKVNAKGLTTLPWGDSDKLRVAEWVLAIGNPFQLSGTVTLGIVSTVKRPGNQVGTFTDFIQTDAAINPGNSGGALVNARGEVVGINSMIVSESGSNAGVGFAIPANLARRIMDELIKNGEILWGSIGAYAGRPITPELSRAYGLGVDYGVYIQGLAANSAARRAGLQRGDIIVAVDGQKITDGPQLDHLITGLPIGKQTNFEIVRNGRHQNIKVTIEKR